jgi:hypothetical protein
LGLLVLLVAMAWFQRDLSRHSLGEVHRAQLVGLARLQGRTLLDETVARFGREANQVGTSLFTRLRWLIDTPFTTLDLKDVLPPPRRNLQARWGNSANGAEATASFALLDHWVRVTRRRTCRDPRGTEEWVGVLELGVRVRVEDRAGRVERELEVAHELRSLLIAAPRPFDQLGLFLGDASTVFDSARANQIREEAVQGHLKLKDELAAADTSALNAQDRKWLRQIVEGMLTREDLEARVPRLPDGPACLYGFTGEVRKFRLQELDLLARLETIKTRLDARKAAYLSAPVDRSKYEQAYWMVDEYSNIFDALWQANSWATTLVERDSDRFREVFEPYMARLTPEYFLDRVSLRFSAEDPLYHSWRAMERSLEGVVDLTAWTQRIELEAELLGRVVLLVGPGGATLRDLNWSTGAEGNRLILVSLGGEVKVEGKVRAAVIMLSGVDGSAPGAFRLGSNSHLRGCLLLPEAGRQDLSLEGTLAYDGFFGTPYPPRRTLVRGTRGEYVMALSPRPLYAREVAR